MTKSQLRFNDITMNSKNKEISMGVKLPAYSHFLLCKSIQQSQRSKKNECRIRLEDHLMRYPMIDLVNFPDLNRSDDTEEANGYRPVRMTIKISKEMDRKLIASTKKTHLRKAEEVALRIEAHLKLYLSIERICDVTIRPKRELREG